MALLLHSIYCKIFPMEKNQRGNDPQHNREPVMTEEEGKEQIIDEVEHLKRQIGLQEEISRNVCSQYTGTICVDLHTKKYRYVEVKDPVFMEKIPEVGDYRNFVDLYCDHFVYAQDRERVRKHLLLSDFEWEAVEEYGYKRIYLQYRRIFGGRTEWVELMISQKVSNPRILLLALRNINEDKKQQLLQERLLRRQNQLISDNYWKTVELMASYWNTAPWKAAAISNGSNIM